MENMQVVYSVLITIRIVDLGFEIYLPSNDFPWTPLTMHMLIIGA